MVRVLVLALGVVVAIAVAVESAARPFEVVGYLPSYRMAAVGHENLTPLTRVVYFNAMPSDSGEIAIDSLPADVREQLKQIREDHTIGLSLTVGGWGHSEHFAAVCANSKTRSRLVRSLKQICSQTAVDSIDFDWEHPETDEQWQSYVALIRETQLAIRPLGGTCSIALASWNKPPAELFKVVDRVHLMSYDHAFPHATLDKSKADIDRVLEYGCPAAKIVLGIPFYGRDKDWKASSYAAIVERDELGERDITKSGVAYNGQETVEAKVALAVERGLAGVMIWEIGQDSQDNERSLLQAIDTAVKAHRSK